MNLPNFFIAGANASVLALAVACGPAPDRLDVRLVTDEPEAVLALLQRRAAGLPIRDEDWRALFATEGYRRLQQRERSFNRPFDDTAFQTFVLSPGLADRAAALRATLERWRTVDPMTAARRAFAYLPAEARLRVKIYPSIKPRPNTFVFETRTDPAIFFYLDPALTPEKFENTLTHELHHIGVGGVCPDLAADSARPVHVRTALAWMGGFAEGRAMLAAAGGPDAHPHAASDSAERAVWERDYARVAADMERLAAFFGDILDGRLTDEAEQTRRGMSFVATDTVPQGAFYTVGYFMARAVERHFGRPRLVATLCDPRRFLAAYNQAAVASGSPWPRWGEGLLRRLEPGEATAPAPGSSAPDPDGSGSDP